MKRISKDFGLMVKSLMVSSGKKYTFFAGLLGIKQQSLYNKLQTGNFDLSQLLTICDYLHCDLTLTKPDGNKIVLNQYLKEQENE